MMLIADSGATKTDWCLMDQENGNAKYFSTQGINLHTQSPVWISKMLLEELPVTVQQMELDTVLFYGAGITSNKLVITMEQTLQYILNGKSVEVNQDLLGAVRALCGQKPGIACILGTGSNSVYYNGKEMIKKSHALGYILGDEGSGAYIGKKLITDYLYDHLPKPLDDHFRMTLQLDKDGVLERIYNDGNPNRYLASFSEELDQFRGIKYVEALLKTCFSDFLKYHVLIYKESKKHPIHFIGSIAYAFGDVIANLCEDRDLRLGKIIQRPIEDLVKYHLNGQEE